MGYFALDEGNTVKSALEAAKQNIDLCLDTEDKPVYLIDLAIGYLNIAANRAGYLQEKENHFSGIGDGGTAG